MPDRDHTILLKGALAAALAGTAAGVVGAVAGLDASLRDALVILAPALAAALIAIVLTLSEARRRRASERELIDQLTGLGSAKRLTSELGKALERRPPRAVSLMIFDLEGFKKYNDSYGHACGDALLWRLGQKLSHAIDPHPAFRLRGDEYGALVPGDGAVRADIERRAVSALFEVGEGFMIRCSHGIVSVPEEAGSVSEALKVADQRVHAERSEARFAGLIDRDDEQVSILPAAPRLSAPRFDVADLSGRLGRALGLAADRLPELEAAAQLRDVGNMAIPDEILHDPGRVGEEGWRFIRFHTLVGERLLGAGFGMHEVARLVRSSHERWDGGGYPDGLVGEEIPVGSRILFVCSAFQDMTSDRAHRTALDVEQALAELRRCAASQFDPAVVEGFCTVINERADAATIPASGPGPSSDDRLASPPR
jgi:diguanylate cyclase (GGDEF)-like protein